jgi:hypothetical protein
MKCEGCKKNITGGAKIQEFDPLEPTTMHVFCSEECKKKWLKTHNK